MTKSLLLALGSALAIGVCACLVPSASGATTAITFDAVWQTKVVVSGPTTFRFGPGAGTSNVIGPITTSGSAAITGVRIRCAVGLVNTNVETLSGAGGTLTLTSKDVGCVTGVGTFHGFGQWTVTGGSGQYAGASGSGTMDGRVNLLRSTGTIVVEGTLTLGP